MLQGKVGGHFSDTNPNNIQRDNVVSLNQKLKLKYGLKYFDINALLFNDATWIELGLTKTAADIIAIKDRHKPPSLSRDDRHLPEAMDIIIARIIENKLIELGYIV